MGRGTGSIRLTLIITGIFIATALLDAATTRAAIVYGNAHELNPLTDATSLPAMLMQELAAAAVVLVACAFAELSVRRSLAAEPCRSFADFTNRIFRRRAGIGWGVLMVCFAVGVLRLLPVLSNACIALSGTSPIIDMARAVSRHCHCSLRATMRYFTIGLFAALTYPLSYWLYLLLPPGSAKRPGDVLGA